MGTILIPVGLAIIFGWPIMLVEMLVSSIENAVGSIIDKIGLDTDRLFAE